MTKEEFRIKLPEKIIHQSYGKCRLRLLENNKHSKTACYINDERYVSGFRQAVTWEELFNEFTTYLRAEGHIK